MRKTLSLGLVALFVTVAPHTSSSQTSSEAAQDSTIVKTVGPIDGEGAPPKRRMVKWNEYDGPISSIRFGLGFLPDFATFSQDDESKQQVSMTPDVGVRDVRFILSGRFKTQRRILWTVGYLYDGAEKSWLFRQTGLDIDIPELYGRLWIGRQKEGYSMVKIMSGYNPWGIERSPAQDAFIPILADGVKWIGYFPSSRVFWNLGWFFDELSENEKFATYDTQVATRIGWQPVLSEDEGKVLHVAVMGRGGEPDNDQLQLRARPEANLAPYFVDTGKFFVDNAITTGVEAYYRKGPWLYGGEYNWAAVNTPTGEDPLFHGGDVTAVWLITGETRAYNAPGAFFEAVQPARTVFEGGPGAWEAAMRLSYIDFDSKNVQGGTFWRLTPMLHWHLSYNVRLSGVYGYGVLDRFGLKGTTQFFQARIQMRI